MRIFNRLRRWFRRRFFGIITTTKPTGVTYIIQHTTEGIHPPYRENYKMRCRANGGHLVHEVDPDTRTALCGHKPKNNNNLMKARGKWLYADSQESPITCKKCNDKLEASV